jgi:hypothetical protein
LYDDYNTRVYLTSLLDFAVWRTGKIKGGLNGSSGGNHLVFVR